MRPGFTPEDEGYRKLAVQEKLALETSRMKMEDALYQPPGARLENGKVVTPSSDSAAALGLGVSYVGIIALTVLAGALIGHALNWFATLKIADVPAYSALGVGIGCAALGGTLFFYRDLQAHRTVAVLQILIAAVGGSLAYFTISNPLEMWTSFGAAVVAAADGFEKLWKAMRK